MSNPVTNFKCRIFENNVDGKISQQGFSEGKIYLKRFQPPLKNFIQVDTSFTSGDHKIACRLYLPKENKKFPSLVFIHGSGPEGMFANQYMAEYLASKGIITLIQDKQGTNKSTGNWTTASFDDLTSDYVRAIDFLKTFKKVDSHKIGIYGHSQGGTIAPLAASKSEDISFVIAAAGIADSVYKQDLYRVENNLKSNGFNSGDVKEAMSYYKTWLEMARTGKGFARLDSLNKKFEKKNWYEWVQAPPLDHWVWKFYAKTGNYNSLDYWKNIKVPVLLVYGEYDQIEDVKYYINKIDEVLIDKSHNNDVTQVILPKSQHNLCIFPKENEKFFWWHISPGYIDFVASWILYRFNK